MNQDNEHANNEDGIGGVEGKSRGYVYILEVKDIHLPVCKIGMTTRNPYERCKEINNSSTGDFIWEVAYYIAVDDCKKLESIVHSKLAPLRQKRREFFGMSADEASVTLNSIFSSQTKIKKIENEKTLNVNNNFLSKKSRTKKKNSFRRIDSEYAELLQFFASFLNIKGRTFGQLNKPNFGMSDGNEGVQWNISIFTDTEIIRIGVNLEGMKYKDWPISKFIQSEIKDSKIIEVKDKLNKPEDVYIRFSRDAWQVTSRPLIVEKFFGGKEFSFAEIDSGKWTMVLMQALECLNIENNYYGRSRQVVTLEKKPINGERVRIMEVSPHLTIWSPICLNGDKQENIEKKIFELQPIYDWVKRTSES